MYVIMLLCGGCLLVVLPALLWPRAQISLTDTKAKAAMMTLALDCLVG